jgi:hypothetical protein
MFCIILRSFFKRAAMNFPPPIPLPPVIEMAEVKDDAPVLQAKLDLGLKKFVICITKDIPQSDVAVLNSYGKVLEYDHECHNNANPELFPWDFLLLDLRQSGDRYFLAKQIYTQRDKYNIICFHYFFETNVMDDYDNDFTKFPKKQGVRQDYEALLMAKRVDKPRWYVSLFTCLFNFYSQTKN